MNRYLQAVFSDRLLYCDQLFESFGLAAQLEAAGSVADISILDESQLRNLSVVEDFVQE